MLWQIRDEIAGVVNSRSWAFARVWVRVTAAATVVYGSYLSRPAAEHPARIPGPFLAATVINRHRIIPKHQTDVRDRPLAHHSQHVVSHAPAPALHR